jgi:hypothetical protein
VWLIRHRVQLRAGTNSLRGDLESSRSTSGIGSNSLSELISGQTENHHKNAVVTGRYGERTVAAVSVEAALWVLPFDITAVTM